MDLLDKVLLEWSVKCDKGYPDLNNEKDLAIFESIFGFDYTITELKKLDYDVLTDKAKKIAEELITLLNITQDQIKPSSSTSIVIYDENRALLFDKIQNSGKFGKATQVRTGNWKKDGITIIVKPTGPKAGEYFELKPKQLGITLGKKITLQQLKTEISRGIQNNSILSELQKRALIYAVDDRGNLSDSEIQDLSSQNGFYNEVNKNFGESHGALLYGIEQGYDSVEFPSASNYPLIDYVLYKGNERTQVSAKAAKTVGNTVKYSDVLAIVDRNQGEVPKKIREFTDIIAKGSVITGAFDIIEKFGSPELKKRVQDYKKTYPEYPAIGKKFEDRQAHVDRINIEKELIKDLNTDPDFSFNDLFNNYVEVKYIKYYLDPKDLKGKLEVIESGNFNVIHYTKNSPGHDSDKLGLRVVKSK